METKLINSKELRMGLTFAQLMSVVTVLGAIITIYVSINVRLSALELRVTSVELNYTELKKAQEKIADDNKNDHIMLQNEIKQGSKDILYWLERPKK